MTSQAKIEANKRNSLKSTGPNTPEGRSKSSMNALKHGMRSKRLAFLREDSFAFENRRQKWMASANPDDDAGEFLVHQYVCLSFELDQVERAHLEHFTSLIENADESELDAVHDLGKRLLFDPTGPTPLYGNPPDARRKRTTSSNGLPVDPNDPALFARKAESSEVGCRWLRERWEELRANWGPENSGNHTIGSRPFGCWAGSRSTPSKIGASPRFSWPAMPSIQSGTAPLTTS